MQLLKMYVETYIIQHWISVIYDQFYVCLFSRGNLETRLATREKPPTWERRQSPPTLEWDSLFFKSRLSHTPQIKLPNSSFTPSSTLWWTCCPRWWQASLTLFVASNRTTIVRPTSSTERRSWCSCGTLESWRRPRSDGRATLTASCSLTSLRGQQAPRLMPRGSGLFKWCCIKMCVSARLITHWLLQVLHLGFPGSRGARCDSGNMFNDTGEGEAGELGDGED